MAGGMHGGGCAWQGACMVGDMCGGGHVHVWPGACMAGGMHGGWGACMAGGVVCGRGHA